MTPEDFEYEEAMLQLAMLPGDLPMLSDALTQKILADAQPIVVKPQVATPQFNHSLVWAGWTVAFGMIPLLLMNLFSNTQPTSVKASKPVSVEEIRQGLINQKADRYASKSEPNQPSGEIVWDGRTQSGVMTLAGLTPNNPKQIQYQLWIVDAGRKQPEPVDGGVFDVNADGTATVPVKAALAIRDAKLFAVTEEPPGGVVVSEKGRRGEFVVVMGK